MPDSGPLILLPDDVVRGFESLGIPARFTAEETRRLIENPPPARPGFLTFPTPEENPGLSVLGLRERLGVSSGGNPCFFFDHPWYLEEPFGRIPCPAGWHSVGESPLGESLDRPVDYAENLRSGELFLPRASEVLLMVFLRLTLTGERLLARKHTWTRDRTGTRRFVSVGAFGKNGVFVSSHEVGYQSRGLGICPARGPSPGSAA
jgi:hypothetical protein